MISNLSIIDWSFYKLVFGQRLALKKQRCKIKCKYQKCFIASVYINQEILSILLRERFRFKSCLYCNVSEWQLPAMLFKLPNLIWKCNHFIENQIILQMIWWCMSLSPHSFPKTMIMVGRPQFDTSCFLSNASWWLERNNNLNKTLIKFDQATKNTFRQFYPWIKRDDNTKDFFSSGSDIFSTPLKRTRWQFAARRNAHQSSLETAHNLFC